MIIEDLIQGITGFFTVLSVSAALLGLVAGILVGALPGLTATMTIAVLTPFTFFMDMQIALPFLLGIYKGAIYAGSIPAILINTPGTNAAAATTLDGFPLARQGKARQALEMSLYASVIADMLATLVLIAVTAPLAAIAIRFSSPEFTILFVFALLMVAGVSGPSLGKGLIAALVGGLIGCIGLDPMSGQQRFTFGFPELTGGISLVPVLIGMFALSEVMLQAERRVVGAIAAAGTRDERRLSWRELRANLGNIVRSSGIGIGLGALPGLGAEIACWLAYGVAKRRSKQPATYGRGSLEGVAAAEAGNNATVPATLIPMLVFGIPGDTVTAVLIGAFMAQGLFPGPLLFQQQGEVIYGLFGILLLTNLLLIVFGLLAIRYLRHVVTVPQSLLLPVVVVLCFAGAYAYNSNMLDVLVLLVGGFAGYVMRKTGVPIPPFVIALLLGPGLENALRQSLLFSMDGPWIFVARPISATLLAVLVATILVFAWSRLRARRAGPER
ncbi:MAG: tripartite tricarboxylate transporter permease [Pseudomonadota bacterium]